MLKSVLFYVGQSQSGIIRRSTGDSGGSCVMFGAGSQLALRPGSKLVSPLIVTSCPLALDQAVPV